MSPPLHGLAATNGISGHQNVPRCGEHLLKKCVPIPAKLYARSKRVSTVEELEELFPGLVALVDASEQPIQRPKRKDMEKSYYSGKAGKHTAKTQYTVNVHGLIIHNTRHSPGCVHDFKVYKTKHLAFPMNLPSRDGSAREEKRANLRSYGDRGYQGAQKVDPDVEVVLPIRCKPGKKLSPEEREINRLQSRIRVLWKMRSAGSKPTGSWGTDTEIR